jgi:basic membrane protein A
MININKAITKVQGIVIAAILIVIIVIGGSAYWVSTVPSVSTTVTETTTNTVSQTKTNTITNTVTNTITNTVTLTPSPKPVRVAIIYAYSPDVGGFDLAAKMGLIEAEELYGIEWTGFEWTSMEERERVTRAAASEGYDLIINHESTAWVPTKAAAPDFPDTWFGITYGAPFDEPLPPNTFGINPSTLDGAYLAGIMAGGMTDSNKIGYPVGFISPVMTATLEAFKMGAKSINPEVQLLVMEIFSWTDAAKGREAAEALIDQGCDVFIHSGGGADVGVVAACRENDLVTITNSPTYGFDFYERNLATFTYRIDKAILYVIGLHIGGNLENKIYEGGLLDLGWSDLSPFEHPEWVPNDVAGQIHKARDAILSGELVIPFIPVPTPP